MSQKLQIKITLRGPKPFIWRRLWIRDNITFEELHYTIQVAMGWHNCHLYEFSDGEIFIGIPMEPSFDVEVEDASKMKIKQHLNRKGDWIMYTYDFGDSWEHVVEVEKVEPIKKGEKLPTCIDGKRNCPPEDCGGIWGFYEMLEILKDKKHPEYEEMLEWMGEDYDPEDFDVEEVNGRF